MAYYNHYKQDMQWLRDVHLPKLLTGREDMRWLRDVHLPKLPRKFHSAVIFGNDDCPSKVAVYRSASPSVHAQPVVYKRKGSGCRLRRAR